MGEGPSPGSWRARRFGRPHRDAGAVSSGLTRGAALPPPAQRPPRKLAMTLLRIYVLIALLYLAYRYFVKG